MTLVDVRAGVCTGPGPCDVTPIGAGKNWVNRVGGLPLYIRAIAQALLRSGHSESEAVSIAVGTVKRWAAGGGNVTAATRARAAKAVAEWEAKKAAAHSRASFVAESDSAGSLLPVAPVPKPPKPRESHAFRGRDLMSCSVCDRPVYDPVHSKKRETGQRAHPAGPAREAHKDTFETAASRVEPKLHSAMAGLFDRQRKATMSRMAGNRGRRMLRSAQPSPDGPPHAGPAITAPPDAAAVFDQAFWTAQTADIVQPVIAEAARLAQYRVAAQLGQTATSISTAADLVRTRTTRLAETVTQTTLDQLRETLAQGVEAGETIPLLSARVRHVFDVARQRAETIARTEVVGALNEAAHSYASNLPSGTVGSKEWLAKHDERTRSTHRVADGQSVPLHAPFHVGTSLMLYPGDPAAPADEVINCFPEWVTVDYPHLRAVTRRWHEGEIIEVRLADGRILAGTPNHPALRSDGRWAALSSLDCGDHLVSARFTRHTLGAPDPYRRPPSIGEVYRLAAVAGQPKGVDGSPPDFHGDGSDGQVEVVSVQRDLFLNEKPASDEQVAQFGLTIANHASLAGRRGQRSILRPIAALSDSERRPASSGVSSSGQSSALLDRHLPEAQYVRFAGGTDRELHRLESFNDRWSSYGVMLGEPKNTPALVVSLTKIIEVNRYPFSGHVFNLDTGDGWYTANDITVANCRCNLLYHPAPLGGAA